MSCPLPQDRKKAGKVWSNVIIINPALMTDEAANNITAWVIENPFDHNHAN